MCQEGPFGVPLDFIPERFPLISTDNWDINFVYSEMRDIQGKKKLLHTLGTMGTYPNPNLATPRSLFKDGTLLRPQLQSIIDSKVNSSKKKRQQTLQL